MGPDADRPLGGVELYVGGVEHAVLHLLYARFWHKVLYDLGYVSSHGAVPPTGQPGLRAGVRLHRLARRLRRGRRGVEKVDGTEVTYTYDGEPVRREYGKMGKSLKNVTTPDEMYAAYGADTMRLFEMFTGPLEQDRPWDTKAVIGSYRLLQRIWRTVVDENTGLRSIGRCAQRANGTLLHKTIAAVREGYETLRFNTSIARITELNNASPRPTRTAARREQWPSRWC